MSFKKILYLKCMNNILKNNILDINNVSFLNYIFENNNIAEEIIADMISNLLSECSKKKYVKQLDNYFLSYPEQLMYLYQYLDSEMKISLLSNIINNYMNDKQLEKLSKYEPIDESIKPLVSVDKKSEKPQSLSLIDFPPMEKSALEKAKNSPISPSLINHPSSSSILEDDYKEVVIKGGIQFQQKKDNYKEISKNNKNQSKKVELSVYYRDSNYAQNKSFLIESFLFNSLHELKNVYNKKKFTHDECVFVSNTKNKFIVNKLTNDEIANNRICFHSYYSECKSNNCNDLPHIYLYDQIPNIVKKYLDTGKYGVDYSTWKKAYDICSRIYK
jgi:hypothetical protein